MKIESILVWPRCVCLGWSESVENKSCDTHHSPTVARAVCHTLIDKGLGCDGQIFPTEARVKVDGEVVFLWKDKEGTVGDNIEGERRMLPPIHLAIQMREEFYVSPAAYRKETQYERANPNLPWYTHYRKRNHKHS